MNFLRKKRLQQRLRQDPYYRFQSMEEVSWAIEIGITIDVNRATIDDWLRLPGLSIHQARSITTLTSQGVQLLSIEDLGAVLNIAVPRLQPLAPLLNFSYYSPALKAPQININQASSAELQQIPVITAPLAEQIIIARQQSPYRNFADLQQRLQLSGQIITELLPWFSFS